MKLLVFESWMLLLYFDLLTHFRGFTLLHQIVRKQRVQTMLSAGLTTAVLCRAVDLACVFYFKQVFCLQRSAVATVLLRRRGWRAEMVIGAQMLPFKSHAWVEIDGNVVNDKPYMADIYRVLERC
jgi:hypothetical protein